MIVGDELRALRRLQREQSAVVLGFGVLLLTGYLVSERMVGV